MRSGLNDPLSTDEQDVGLWSRVKARLFTLKTPLTIGLILLVLTLALVATAHLVKEVSYHDLKIALATTPRWTLLAALGFTFISFCALAVYDWEGLAYVGRKLPVPIVTLTSFCAYAVGNVAGFGPLTAGAIRYRFYAAQDVDAEDIARIIAFVTIAFGVGLTGVAGVGLLASPPGTSSLSLPPLLAKLIGAAILSALFLLWLFAGSGREIRIFSRSVSLPSRSIIARQFFATFIDVCSSAMVLWVLLPGHGQIDIPAFIAIYAVAIGLGVLSHVPGGVGVFETVIIAALGGQMPIEKILGALVLYRVVYYLVPLAIASLIIAFLEGRRLADSKVAGAILKIGVSAAPPILGAFAAVAAAVMIFSSVAPLGRKSLLAMAEWLPLSLIEGSHFLGSVIGVTLLFVARGLVYRLDGAWWAATTLVAVSIVLSLLKAAAWNEALLLLALLVALIAARRKFSRRSSLLHQTLTPGWILAVLAVLVMAAALVLFAHRENISYNSDLWWQFELSKQAPASIRALMGAALTAGFLGAFMLLRPVRGKIAIPEGEEMARALKIAAAQPRADAMLAAMGDKNFMFSDDGLSFIMYGRRKRSWIALGDPVGPRENWPELVWRFVETARAQGERAVFYQIAPASLSLYADAGLRAFKLGEEARIDLLSFNLKGTKRTNMRTALNRAEREGIEFSLLSGDEIDAALPELRAISDNWLAKHQAKEKSFSLGAFNESYVRQQSVAVLRREGHIVAFATIMQTDLKEEAAVDLMRFSSDAGNRAMDVLMVRIALAYKEAGYSTLSLGMAPLSGMPRSEAAPIWSRLGRLVFEHGERLYNFSGLRAFKEKFQPDWLPRYLAVSGGATPVPALADAAFLIGGGVKGVIKK